jgi:hypothetical protein
MRAPTGKTNSRQVEAYLALRRRKRRHGFSPASVAGLKLWVRAESLVSLANNAPVATWKDESGNSHDLVQATGSKRPLYVGNVEGLPGVTFDGVDDVLATAGNAFATDTHTILMVARPSQVGNFDWVGTGGTNAGDVLLQVGDDQTVHGHVWRAGPIVTISAGYTRIPTNEFSLLEQQTTATQLAVLRQGMLEKRGNANGSLTGVSKPVIMGSRGAGYNFGGIVRALLVFQGVPAEADLARVRDYLMTGYVLAPQPPFQIPAPIISDGYFQWDNSQTGWVDNFLFFSFNGGPLDVGVLEVWERDSLNASHLIATVSSDEGDFQHASASQNADTFYYKMRYVNGRTVGPFSAEFAITVDI